MEIFIVVFALVFIVGFVIRAAMTTKCLHCRGEIDRGVSVCKHCGRDV